MLGNIVGISMLPTLKPNSIHFFLKTTHIDKRGTIVVFNSEEWLGKRPESGLTKYIKRIVGLPNDVIEITFNGVVTSINGIKQEKPSPANIKRFKLFAPNDKNVFIKANPYSVETDGAKHFIFLAENDLKSYKELPFYEKSVQRIDARKLNATHENGVYRFVVPEDKYFILSDNRVVGIDSRNNGFVPKETLIAKLISSY